MYIVIVVVEQLKNLMVVGVDTYHDSAKKDRSVGGFVASMNQTLTRYYSNCAFQSSHEELQNNLCTFMIGISPVLQSMCMCGLIVETAISY